MRLAHALVQAAGNVEVFTFGTRLTRVTPALRLKRREQALNAASFLVSDWDGGTRMTLGTPAQRSLVVRAYGAVASIIPPLEMTLPESFRGYPDPPSLREAIEGDALVGIRTETMSLVPGEPGAVELPPVRLTWFDTEAEVPRVAVLDARPLTVIGSQPNVDPGPN